MAGAAFYVNIQRIEADKQRIEADKQRQFAQKQEKLAKEESQKAKRERDNALRTQSLFLSELSKQQTEQGNTTNGILLALEALPKDISVPNRRPYVAQAEEKLYKAVFKRHKEYLVIQHKQDINYAVFSPDSQKILTASDDNTACLWDAQSGKQLFCLKHEGKVNYAAFSSDGTKVITASEDKTARLWDTKSDTIHILKHETRVHHAVFITESKEVITVTSENINLWNAENGEKLSSLFTKSYLEPSRRADSDKPSVLKKRREFMDGFKLSDRLAIMKFAVVSPDGKKVITAYYNAQLKLWDIPSKKLLSVLQHKNVNYAAFSPDSTKIVTASDDNTARLWDGKSGQALYSMQHEDKVNHAVFSHDGTKVITTSDDNTACLWDTQTAQKKLCLPHDDVNYAVFSHDSNKVITNSFFHSRVSINLRDIEPIRTTLDGGEVILWNARSGLQLFVLNLKNGIKYSAISYDDKKILTVSGNTVHLWDISQLLLGHEDRVSYASFNPEGDKIVTTSLDNTARIWDAQNGQLLAILQGHTARVNYATFFSLDGQKIVTVSDDRTARLWDAQNAQQLFVLKGHQAEVNYASFSPDSQKVVTASMDQTARLWDVQNGRHLFTLAHQSAVYHAAFNFKANHSRLITASLDKTAHLWNSQSGELLAMMPHENVVYYAAFNPNGRQVVTVSTDEIVRLWRIFPNTQALIDYANQIVPHQLTQEQRQQFFLE